jgi:hypothetical protein
MDANKSIEALQNAVISINMAGLNVYEKIFDDKRKTAKMYFLQIKNETISPVLDYSNMNHFILGFLRAKTIFNQLNNK